MIFICTLIAPSDLNSKDYAYPKWSIAVGWFLTSIPLSCIPIYIIYKISICKGTFVQVTSNMVDPRVLYRPDCLTVLVRLQRVVAAFTPEESAVVDDEDVQPPMILNTVSLSGYSGGSTHV